MNLNNIAKLEYKNKVILANKRTGYWVRITNEVYNYIMQAILLGYSEEKFIQSFEHLEDKDYIKKLLYTLNQKGILGDEVDEVKNKVTLEITNRCNLNCTHCCVNANEHKQELSIKQIVDILNKAIKWNPKSIVVTGGEPLVRNDIVEILQYLRANYDGYIILATNGTLFDKKNVEIITKCVNQIDISIDGVDEDSCKPIRGKGVFKKVIDSIKLLQATNFKKISLSMILSEYNLKLVDQFMELNQILETEPIIRRLSLVGRALENKKVFLEKEDTYIAGDKLECEDKEFCTYLNCQESVSKLYIRFDGTVYACQTMQEVDHKICDIDNLLSFDEIKSNKLNMLINQLLEKNSMCKECKVQPFCWKCPIEIMEYTNTHDMQRHCNSVRQNLFDLIWEE